MLPLEHTAILSTFIELSNVIKSFVLSIFEWPLKTGFTFTKALITMERKFISSFENSYQGLHYYRYYQKVSHANAHIQRQKQCGRHDHPATL